MSQRHQHFAFWLQQTMITIYIITINCFNAYKTYFVATQYFISFQQFNFLKFFQPGYLYQIPLVSFIITRKLRDVVPPRGSHRGRVRAFAPESLLLRIPVHTSPAFPTVPRRVRGQPLQNCTRLHTMRDGFLTGWLCDTRSRREINNLGFWVGLIPTSYLTVGMKVKRNVASMGKL